MSEHSTGTIGTAGTVSFLLAEIEAGGKHWEQDPGAMGVAQARYDAILRGAAYANSGSAFSTIGDTAQAAFPTPLQALQAAIDAQMLLFAEQWPSSIGEVKVRMAIHTGIATGVAPAATTEHRSGDLTYVSSTLSRMPGMLSVGHGGQVLISAATQELVRDLLSGLRPAEPLPVQLLDLGEHRLKDFARPEHIYQLLVPSVPSLPSHFPPLRTPASRPNNLPLQLTSLVGRETQVVDVCSLLRHRDVRLATITGPGGMGKTRLALQVGAKMLEDFADGVWLVELATLDDPSLVAPTVAEALGVQETSRMPLIDALKEYLAGMHLLLILDNFEQVMDASGVVTAIVKAAPGVKALVTSRVKLNVYGEREYMLPPLSLPPLQPSRAAVGRAGQAPLLSPAKLARYESVSLFVERARAAKTGFEITNDNVQAVAEICVRLDGLPLAIELAAARVKMLPPQALLTRLSNRLKILTGGGRDLPARQQTLRGAIEWSYDLLSEGEQQLFRRMAVFSGGRSLEALEAVCSISGTKGSGLLESDVLDGVQSLVDKSLLQQREGAGGEPRIWMLETIQEYAVEKLEESGEAEILRNEHLNYFAELAQEARSHLMGVEQQEWLEKLEEEHDNVRASLVWAARYGRAGLEGSTGSPPGRDVMETGLRLGAAMTRFWEVRGYLTEGRELLSTLLAEWESAAPGGYPPAGQTAQLAGAGGSHTQRVPAASLAKALQSAGILAFRQGDVSAAGALLERAIEVARELGDKEAMGNALNNMATVAYWRGDYPMSRACDEQSLALSRELGDKRGVSASLNNLGTISYVEGDYRTARTFYEQSLALKRELGDKQSMSSSLINLGNLSYMEGDYQAARSLYEQSLALCREMGDRSGMSTNLGNLGNTALMQGDYQGARALHEEGLILRRDLGDRLSLALSLAGLGEAWAESAREGQRADAEKGARLLGA